MFEPEELLFTPSQDELTQDFTMTVEKSGNYQVGIRVTGKCLPVPFSILHEPGTPLQEPSTSCIDFHYLPLSVNTLHHKAFFHDHALPFILWDAIEEDMRPILTTWKRKRFIRLPGNHNTVPSEWCVPIQALMFPESSALHLPSRSLPRSPE